MIASDMTRIAWRAWSRAPPDGLHSTTLLSESRSLPPGKPEGRLPRPLWGNPSEAPTDTGGGEINSSYRVTSTLFKSPPLVTVLPPPTQTETTGTASRLVDERLC